MFFLIILGGVLVCASLFIRGTLNQLGLLIIGFSAFVIGSIYLAEWMFWSRWLRKLGMRCPACQHPLSGHYGTVNPATGGCSKCAEIGRCRNIAETGLCDKCGQRIFDL